MKIGDRYVTTIDNSTPGGLTVEGEITMLTADTLTMTTQFGVDMTLPRPSEPAPVEDG